MKRQSIFRVPIIKIDYLLTNKVTTCRITWRNPISRGNQVSTGVARCNPDDDFDVIKGERIAESRAKQNLYKTYSEYINKTLDDISRKHRNLNLKEYTHEYNLIEQLTD